MKLQSGFRGAYSPRWAESDDQMLQEGHELGFSLSDLAVLLDRSKGGIRMRLATLQARTLADAQAAAEAQCLAARMKARRCLRCQTEFLSPHAGVRLCDGCRAG